MRGVAYFGEAFSAGGLCVPAVDGLAGPIGDAGDVADAVGLGESG